jgi:potassium/chloride transporter 9
MAAGQHSNFQARTAVDEAGELSRRSSLPVASGDDNAPQQAKPDSGDSLNPYDPATENTVPPLRQHSFTKHLLGIREDVEAPRQRSVSSRRIHTATTLGEDSLTAKMHNRDKKSNGDVSSKRHGMAPRPVGGDEKLGTFSGVFVPTSLNVLSILMFLRFGFILGQGGVLGMMGMLIASYLINLVTTLSLSAIASNGTVRGGGAYYLISRSLGPEFGGSIGVVFYLGFAFNTGMNAVGLIDCITQNFGKVSGNWAQVMPEGGWWEYLWATVVLVICTAYVCTAMECSTQKLPD